jgi:hypothetical protein
MIDGIGVDPGIPPDVIDEIRATLSLPITLKELGRKMKELGMFRYYDHIPFIYNHIMNIPQPPMIPEEVKTEIMQMFTQIVRGHRTVFNGHRSFFNHTYVLTKILKEMRPFPGSILLMLHLDEKKFKSVEKIKCCDADWDAVVDFLMCPSTPPPNNT